MSRLTFALAFGQARKAGLYPSSGSWGPGGIQLGVGENFPYLSTQGALAAYRGWVYAATSTISTDLAELAVRVTKPGRGDRRVPVARHPLLDLLARPNANQAGNAFRQLAQLHLDLSGEFFVYIARGKSGAPEALHLLWPDRTYIVPHPDEYVMGYLHYTWNGAMLALLPEEVIHVKYANPHDPYRGYSPVRALGFVPQINDALRAYVAQYLGNDARPGGVLSTEKDLTKDQKALLVSWWNELHQGTGGAGKTAILSNGMRYQPIQDGLGALKIGELARLGCDEVLAAYNVPKSKVGLVADANRSNAEAADHTYRSNSLGPRAAVWNEQLLTPLARMFPGSDRDEAALENPVPRDVKAEREAAMNDLKAGTISIRAYHERLGNPEAADAPDVYLVPGGVTVVENPEDLVGAAPTAPPPTESPPTENAEADPDAAQEDTPKKTPAKSSSKKRESDGPAVTATSRRLRAHFAREYAARKDGTFDRGESVRALAEELRDPMEAVRVSLEIEAQVQQRGLLATYETLKSSRVTRAIARALGGPHA